MEMDRPSLGTPAEIQDPIPFISFTTGQVLEMGFRILFTALVARMASSAVFPGLDIDGIYADVMSAHSRLLRDVPPASRFLQDTSGGTEICANTRRDNSFVFMIS